MTYLDKGKGGRVQTPSDAVYLLVQYTRYIHHDGECASTSRRWSASQSHRFSLGVPAPPSPPLVWTNIDSEIHIRGVCYFITRCDTVYMGDNILLVGIGN